MFKDDIIKRTQLITPRLCKSKLRDEFWEELKNLYLKTDYTDAERRVILNQCAEILRTRSITSWDPQELEEEAMRLLYELKMKTLQKDSSILMDCMACLVVEGKYSDTLVNELLEKYDIGFRYSSVEGWDFTPKKTIVFISHASKDKLYVYKFVELLEDCGLDTSNMFCSSVPEYAIPLGKNIYSFIRELYTENQLIVCYMLSDNYYDSVPCLNEMGASWVSNQEYVSILLPKFQYQKIEGAIDAGRIGIKLDADDAQNRLRELVLNLQDKFGLKRLPEHQLDRYIDNFLSGIK